MHSQLSNTHPCLVSSYLRFIQRAIVFLTEGKLHCVAFQEPKFNGFKISSWTCYFGLSDERCTTQWLWHCITKMNIYWLTSTFHKNRCVDRLPKHWARWGDTNTPTFKCQLRMFMRDATKYYLFQLIGGLSIETCIVQLPWQRTTVQWL